MIKRKLQKAKKPAIWALIAAMALGNAVPAFADARTGDETGISSGGKVPRATSNDAEKEKDPVKTSTSNDADKEFDLEDMPEIGSSGFTKWFVDHVEFEELWELVSELLSDV